VRPATAILAWLRAGTLTGALAVARAAALTAATAATITGCGGPEPRSPVPAAGIPATDPDVSGPAPTDAGPPPIDAGPPLGEIEARLEAADRFRRAGYRIRQDVRITRPGAYDVTLDGWDPQRRVGYEYIAPEEVGLDLTTRERVELARDTSLRVLILDRTSRAETIALIDAFLAELTVDAGPDQP
jgi:hypothetical protein